MMQQLLTSLDAWVAETTKVDSHVSMLLATLIAVFMAVGLIAVIELSIKQSLLQFINRLALKTSMTFDDVLVRHNVFPALARLVPPVLVHLFSVPLLAFYPEYVSIVHDGAVLYLIVTVILLLFAFLDALLDYFAIHPLVSRLPVKSFVQVIKSATVFIGLVLVIAKLMGKSPLAFFSGLGAFTAVLLLVFKDSLLGLLAGIQLSSNDLVRIGDWIEMPKYNADGDVVDISLVTVSVQNWDKTISTIPAYSLVSEGFKNWRGMSESDGRRIKRSLKIDMTSVRFCDDAMLSRLLDIELLRPYLNGKMVEISSYNMLNGVDTRSPVNGRRLTNLGTFRAYVDAYLRQHPQVNNQMTLIIRHLQPQADGIPLELYLFSREKQWAIYERVQADIMDHLLAVLPHFGLRIYQNPGWFDVEQIGRSVAEVVRHQAPVPEAAQAFYEEAATSIDPVADLTPEARATETPQPNLQLTPRSQPLE